MSLMRTIQRRSMSSLDIFILMFTITLFIQTAYVLEHVAQMVQHVGLGWAASQSHILIAFISPRAGSPCLCHTLHGYNLNSSYRRRYQKS